MELTEHVSYGTTREKLEVIDEIFCNILEHFKNIDPEAKLEKKKYPRDLVLSYFLHKIAFISVGEIFEKFPKLDQEVQRREMIRDHFKTIRNIYNKKYKEIEEERNGKRRVTSIRG